MTWDATLACTFCGNTDGFKVVGPCGVQICHACVEQCVNIISEVFYKKGKTRAWLNGGGFDFEMYAELLLLLRFLAKEKTEAREQFIKKSVIPCL